MSGENYEKVVDGLPDNNTGAITAAAVRSIIESVTPAFFYSNDEDGLTLNLTAGLWGEVPIDGTIYRSDDFDPSPGLVYNGDARRIAQIHAVLHSVEDSQAEFQLIHQLATLESIILASGQIGGGFLQMTGMAVLESGSEVLLRARPPADETINVQTLWIGALGHLGKSPALVQPTP